jgi:oxygen-independent coproporphyrinogen-3 oxidase
MPASDLEMVLEKIYSKFTISDNVEISLEANPGEAPLDRLREYRHLGVNRLSMGFQSFDHKLLGFMGRIHSPDDCFITYDNARKVGFDNISTDMLFDIPGQSLDRWKEDLARLVDISPEHISAYSLTVEAQTPLWGLVRSGKVKMPSESLDIAMFTHARKFLSENGYSSYEISNYVKKGHECRHNLHYWNIEPYLAFGPSAHGFNGKKRWWNVKSLDTYFEIINNNQLPIENEETLTNVDHINELILNGLRLSNGIQLTLLKKYLNDKYDNYLESSLKKWPGLKIEDNFLKLDEKGILIADEVCSDLFIEN